MKRSELLGVILKAIGIWSLVGGIAGLPQALRFSHQYPDEQAFLLMIADTFAGPGILIVSGWFLIRTTDWFVGIAYPTADLAEGAVTSDGSAPELFAVILKALGYWEVLNGIVRLPYDLASAYRSSTGAIHGIAYSGIVIVAGCFLIFATDWFVRIAYHKTIAIDDNETEGDTPPA